VLNIKYAVASAPGLLTLATNSQTIERIIPYSFAAIWRDHSGHNIRFVVYKTLQLKGRKLFERAHPIGN
jgi:hypothetical protein